MNSNIKVSIIMPLFNTKNTLKRALDSILYQTYKNYEIIVIDGGSTDGTLDIINEYIEHITYFISEKDKGYGDALNKGIKVANGDYYIILAGDDFFIPGGLESFINEVNGRPDVFLGNMLVLKESNVVTKFKRAKTLKELEVGKVMAHPATFFKLSTLRKYNGYNIEYKINCDTELIMRLYKAGASFQISDFNTFISVFVCGGMSVQESLSDSLSSLNEINQMEEVAIKYGAKAKEARKRRKKIIYKQMKASLARKIFRGTIGHKILYTLDGQKPLSSKDLKEYGIPTEYIR